MLVGAMNHPGRDVLEEIKEIARQGFDYVDFTHEPPKAFISAREAVILKQKIHQMGYVNFQFVGHTAFYLPIATVFPSLFKASLEIFSSSIPILTTLGAKQMTIHYDRGQTVTDPATRVERHISMIKSLYEYAPAGFDIVLENSPKGKGQIKEFAEILSAVPIAGLHLDIAHAWVAGGMKEIEGFLELGQNGRLKHVHISENDGSDDQHLPLGTGFKNTPPWPEIIKMLKSIGYDETITLEVFASDRRNRVHSMDLLHELWEAA